jgi:hypothetical protein
MRAARSAETTRIRVDPGKLELPVHLHVENSRDLGQVFQATPKRIKEALERQRCPG